MDKEFSLDAGIPPSLHFEQSLASSPPMPTWQTLSSADCFLNNDWNKPTNQYTHFESSLGSIAPSNLAFFNNNFAIRELIGNLGKFCNPGELSPDFTETTAAANCYVGAGNGSAANASCFSTPLNTPPKLHMPLREQVVKENLPNLVNSIPLNPSLPALSADPGFAERAAKFSCFGSRSLNGRTSQFGLDNPEFHGGSKTPLSGNDGKLSRISSSPAIKAAGSSTENKSPAQPLMEMLPANGSVAVSEMKFNKLSGSAASSNEESSVSELLQSSDTMPRTPSELNSRKRKGASRGKAKEDALVHSAKPAKGKFSIQEAEEDASDAKRSKSSEGDGNNFKVKETKGNTSTTGDESQKEAATANPKPPEPPKDYIHVRARRGQATDSHSLAERVRREKISERMKLLQDLVPGCNKVTGKALMLDEIINYVQSLQRQVEFLSMKLASVNPNMDGLLSKDMFLPNGSLQHQTYPLDSSATVFYGQQPQQSPQIPAHLSNGAMAHHDLAMQLPSAVVDNAVSLPQYLTLCEDDLQSLVQMGFGQSSNKDTDFTTQSFDGPNQTCQMKIEL